MRRRRRRWPQMNKIDVGQRGDAGPVVNQPARKLRPKVKIRCERTHRAVRRRRRRRRHRSWSALRAKCADFTLSGPEKSRKFTLNTRLKGNKKPLGLRPVHIRIRNAENFCSFICCRSRDCAQIYWRWRRTDEAPRARRGINVGATSRDGLR